MADNQKLELEVKVTGAKEGEEALRRLNEEAARAGKAVPAAGVAGAVPAATPPPTPNANLLPGKTKDADAAENARLLAAAVGTLNPRLGQYASLLGSTSQQLQKLGETQLNTKGITELLSGSFGQLVRALPTAAAIGAVVAAFAHLADVFGRMRADLDRILQALAELEELNRQIAAGEAKSRGGAVEALVAAGVRPTDVAVKGLKEKTEGVAKRLGLSADEVFELLSKIVDEKGEFATDPERFIARIKAGEKPEKVARRGPDGTVRVKPERPQRQGLIDTVLEQLRKQADIEQATDAQLEVGELLKNKDTRTKFDRLQEVRRRLRILGGDFARTSLDRFHERALRPLRTEEENLEIELRGLLEKIQAAENAKRRGEDALGRPISYRGPGMQIGVQNNYGGSGATRHGPTGGYSQIDRALELGAG